MSLTKPLRREEPQGQLRLSLTITYHEWPVNGRKLALRRNDLFYEGVATSTRSVFRSEPHFRDRGFGVIQQADDTKPHVFAIGA